jgi:hypothetical protein
MLPDEILGAGWSPYELGASLATRDDVLLVGAPSRDDGGRSGGPRLNVFVVRRAGPTWTLAQALEVPEPDLAEGYARAMALGPGCVVVGAPGHENGDASTYVFEADASGQHRLRGAIDSPERTESWHDVFSEYGVSVAADAEHVFVGASLESHENEGVVHVFDRRALPARREIATLRGTRRGEGLGTSMALAGDTLVVGAAASARIPGSVYVYRREGRDRWRELGRIDGSEPGDELGASVAISGSRIALTAPGRADLRGPPGSGRVQVHELAPGLPLVATVAEQPGFGSAVALHGDRLAIGDLFHPFKGAPRQTGRVGLYRLAPGGAVTLDGWLTLPDPLQYARLGSAVVLGADFVAAGAPGFGDSSGAGRVAIKYW